MSEVVIANNITLIIYPPYTDASNVIASMLTIPSIVENITYIMTQEINLVNAAAGQDLPSKIYLKYEGCPSLSSAISKKSFIMIDSLKTFRLKNMWKHLSTKSPGCKLIIFTSNESDQNDKRYLDRISPNYGVLTHCLSNYHIGLIYKIDNTVMSDSQKKLYMSANQKDPEDLLKICNFVYPEKVDPKDSIDADRGENGWIDDSIFSDLIEYSPKFHNLLTIIVSQYADKHVVYTRFIKSHGIDMINTLLNYLGINHTIITEENDTNDQIGKITTFCGESDQKVLIMNTLPRAEINDVGHIHFLEGTEENTVYSFINSIYKARLFTKTRPLSISVHFHISSYPNNDNSNNDNSNNDNSDENIETPDVKLYLKVSGEIIEKQGIFDSFMSKSKKICYIKGPGISVI